MQLDIEKTGVLAVDLQGDFTEYKNGSLAVEGTGEDYLNKVLDAVLFFKDKGLALFGTQDYHPKDHVSFFTNHQKKEAFDTIEVEGRVQVLWPPHCVMNTANADFLVDRSLFEEIIQKGRDPRFDSYSGFFDDGGAATDLNQVLAVRELETLLIFGLATDFCVKFTALDALKSGFNVVVIGDLCRGVAADTTQSAVKEMKQAGIQVMPYSEITPSLQKQ